MTLTSSCKLLWTWMFAPGVPPTRYKEPSGWTAVNAFKVCAGRLPGAMMFGDCGSSENPVNRLFSRIPVSGIIQELPKPWNTDWIHETALPSESATKKYVVSLPSLTGATSCPAVVIEICAARWSMCDSDKIFSVFTAMNSGSPRIALRSANPIFLDSTPIWIRSASDMDAISNLSLSKSSSIKIIPCVGGGWP